MVDPAFATKARAEWGLTSREIDVAWLTAQGVTAYKETARRLGISVHTVKDHRTNIRRKMTSESRVDYHETLLAIRAHSSDERAVRTVALGALAADFAALERLVRGVLTYLAGETT